MYKDRQVAVIIPALNEEASVGRVLADIPDYVDRVIVTDNGSTDRTPQLARQAGAEVVLEPERGYGAAGLTLALAVLIKFFALFLVPIAFLYFKGRERLVFVSVFLLTAAVLYLPFVPGAGWSVFGSLWAYLGRWEFNGSVYGVLKLLVGSGGARTVCMLLFTSATVFAVFYRRSATDVYFRALCIFGAYVLFTPTLFPWYLVWLLPLLMLYRRPSFLVLTGICLLSYHVLIAEYTLGMWLEHWYLRALEYLPFYAVLAYELWSHRGAPREVIA
ncbi:MAG: glycosyltransferase family 2 protein [bacterium]|nr:glycosyltransferase family 2 protein [bacterium]